MRARQYPFSLYRPSHTLPQVALTVIVLCLPGMSNGQNRALPPGYDDHQNMMDQLGIKAIRRGPDPNNQSTFDETIANPYRDSMPDVLRMKNGTKVTRARQWPKRRAEIVEDFERSVLASGGPALCPRGNNSLSPTAGAMERLSRRVSSPTTTS